MTKNGCDVEKWMRRCRDGVRKKVKQTNKCQFCPQKHARPVKVNIFYTHMSRKKSGNWCGWWLKKTTSSGQNTAPYAQSKKCGNPGARFPPFFRAKSRKILKIIQRLGFWKISEKYSNSKKNTKKIKNNSSLKFGRKNLEKY